MKRLLLCVDKDQFKEFNYSQPWHSAMKSMGFNSGNNVFQFALQKILTSPHVKLDIDNTFLNDTEKFIAKADYINNTYDALITSPANVLALWAKETALPRWTNAIIHIKKPFHFVGVGAQSNLNYSLEFVDKIRYEAKEFLNAILNTGGSIGLRGHFSGEVLKKLGYLESEYEVIGCPSLFMNGPKLNIMTPAISEEDFKPVINGFRCWFDLHFHRFFFKYPQSIYVCQDEFYKLLYQPNKCVEKDLNYLRTDLFEKLYKENRVALYCEFLAWYNDLKNRELNFSMGSRIHGNVVSLLAGIPAYVDVIDSRTRELSEYFNIPNSSLPREITDPYELYCSLDYKNFNSNFPELFKTFKKFFTDISLPFLDNEQYISEKINKVVYTKVYKNDKLEEIIKIKKILSNKKKKTWTDKLLHFYSKIRRK